jgi:hypothetical protein
MTTTMTLPQTGRMVVDDKGKVNGHLTADGEQDVKGLTKDYNDCY